MGLKYGREGITTFLDDLGSKVSVERQYSDGKVMKPVRHTYEIRNRVKTGDLTTPAQILDQLLQDTKKVDRSVRIENTKIGTEKGFYYIVECYTMLEY